MSAENVIVNEAVTLANRRAQRIEIIGKHGTEPFESFAGLEGKSLAIRIKFDYSAMPEVKSELQAIARSALDQSIRKHAGLLVKEQIENA